MAERIAISETKESGVFQVSYSEFDGTVHVEMNGKSIKSATMSSSSKGSVSARDLRKLPLGAIETLIRNNKILEPMKSRPEIIGPGRTLDEQFLTSIATYYLDSLARNERPLVSIAEKTGAPHNTVARWVLRSRKEGFLK